ncbi:MAG: methylenetetrahydrofolate reductase [NAD(P)H] [Lachnospiraceae bacterium]|nr:methylenetetrahydrofolate reductase [NAD(P)H] [Lachnospiraceae bacterium]
MKISEIYNKKKRTLSFEIFPPKKESDLHNIDETLSVLCKLEPDFISVTFGAGGSINKNHTIEVAKKIRNDYGIEPIVHLTCLNYGKSQIDEFAKALENEGIKNVLALRGDKTDDLEPSNDFLHASDLISYMKKDHDFCFLGACYPECHPESKGSVDDMEHLKEKTNAGAGVLLSQLFFDNDLFYRFRERCRIAGINVPIIPGIMPVTRSDRIRKMVGVCGASIPERFRKIIDRYENNNEALFDAGLSYAISQIIDLLSSDADGIHLYTMNNPLVAKRICEGIKNIV